MQVLIDIPNWLYNAIMEHKEPIYSQSLGEAVRDGMPLPKGHGKLVDLDQMCDNYWDGNYMEIHAEDLKNIKTIIEADTEDKEQEEERV